MKIIECEQGSEEWIQARLGRPSASNYAKLVKMNGDRSTQAGSYIQALAAEMITGEPTYVKVTEHMERGTELEPYARDEYRRITGALVDEVGFCLHEDIEAGASPDGLIGEEGGLEIKCPSPSVHIEYLEGNKLPSKYFQQVQGCLWVTERIWWDFMSYHPDMEPLIVTVERDEEFIGKLENQVRMACDKIRELVDKYSRV